MTAGILRRWLKLAALYFFLYMSVDNSAAASLESSVLLEKD